MPKEPTNETEQDNELTPEEAGTWEEDQKKLSYYYDDSHGYQPYEPEHDQDEDDDYPNTKT